MSRLADQVVVLNAGRVTRQGPAFELLSDLEFPSLAGVPAYGAVIPVRVSEQRETEGLTKLSFDGGELAVPRIERPVGDGLRIRIRAEDILLALEAPSAISANNVLPATVTGIVIRDGAHADVQLACGGTKLVARITRFSLARLQIVAAMPIFAIVKSVTIDARFRPPSD
jgi:molybdate transport system ATP-binding protein